MKAIIAAGGKGTRLRPLTFSSNKHLIPIANKPLLLYPIEDIAELGIRDVGVIINDAGEAVKALLGKGEKWGLRITYIYQPEPLGLAHVVKISQKFLGKSPFIYHLGDNIFSGGVKEAYDHFVKAKPDAVLTVVKHKENYRLGVPFFDRNKKLVRVVEKPQKPPNQFGVPGLYMFNHNVFKAFSGKDAIKPSPRGELEIVDLYNYLLDHGFRVDVTEIKGEWRDPGKFDDSLEANRLILDLKMKHTIAGKVDKDSKITGKANIGKNSEVINSQIVGPAIIGENVLVKDSYIGPHTAIADDCEVIGSQIENSIVMQNTHLIDIRARIEASMIGKEADLRTVKTRTPSYSFFIGDHCRVELPF